MLWKALIEGLMLALTCLLAVLTLSTKKGGKVMMDVAKIGGVMLGKLGTFLLGRVRTTPLRNWILVALIVSLDILYLNSPSTFYEVLWKLPLAY